MNKQGFKKTHIIFLVIFVCCFLGLRIWQLRWPTTTLELKGETIKVQVAKTIRQATKGLGGRETFGAYDGMVFLFDSPKKHGIVMRDMEFPIDIVWLNRGKVVDIAPRVQPEPGASENELRRYYPRIETTMVLELPAGWTELHDLKIGDSLRASP